MKNFRIKHMLEHRNSLRYLLSNPFKELPTYTILKYLKNNKIYIVNKIEKITEEDTRLHIQLKNLYLNVIISKDHLITVEIIKKKKETLKTRNIEEVLNFLKDKIK